MSDWENAGGKGGRRKGALYVFAVLFLVLCLVPFVGMIWTDDAPATDEDSRSAFPALQEEDGSYNLYFLSNLGDYFEDHFAYRNLAIDANARLRAGIFKTSPTEQVIVGRDGWLFYGNTLSDFRASAPLSEREIHNITFNLSLMQGYTNAMGAEFVVTIAPNKNSLYPAYMPYYLPGAQNNNMALLGASLAAEEVNYLNLFELFGTQSEELYFQTDTHWTTEGALLVTDALLAASRKSKVTVAPEAEEATMTGDLERMLYPITAGTEQSTAYTTGNWQFTGASTSVEDDIATTSSTGGDGSLLMFRDSFANTLIPYLAPEFSRAEFSKMIPYNFTQIADLKPSVVIVERAERHINLFAESPPFLYAPTTGLVTKGELDTESFIDWRIDGDFRVLEGSVDENHIDTLDIIYVSLESRQTEQVIYVPFQVNILANPGETQGTPIQPINSQYGFRLFLDERTLTDVEYTVKVIVEPSNGNAAYIVKTATLKK
ncbi:MAG: hypothetical protein FWE96_00895 [Coriobacteriia bacterium]|nr:hypothetical protein [Coriobacteriia bacterium]